MAQQQLLAQELSVSQILRKYRRQLTQIRERHDDKPDINTLGKQQQLLAQE
jgi:hypothetical protein